MGERRSTGDRDVPSTQATSSEVRAAILARSPARWPAAFWARALLAAPSGPPSASDPERSRSDTRWRRAEASSSRRESSTSSGGGGGGRRRSRPSGSAPAGSTSTRVPTRWPRAASSGRGQVGHAGDPVGAVGAGDGPGHGGQGPEPPRGDLGAERRRHHLLDLVGLVEDHHLVLGQDGAPAGQVGAVEVGVDHHHVGRRRRRPGPFGEAGAARGAAEGARALAGADAHHRPGPGVRLEGQVGPVAVLGLAGPVEEAADVVDQPVPAPRPTPSSPAVARLVGARTPRRAAAGPPGRRSRPPAGGRGSCSGPSARRRRRAGRTPRPRTGGPSRPAGPGGPWWPWPRRPCDPRARPAPRRPATCRCRCRPGPPGAARCRWPGPRPRPSRAGPTAAPRRRAGRR